MVKPYRTIKPMFEKNRWRIFPGDLVYINHGPHKREAGKVLQVIKDRRVPQVIVEGINLRKKKVFTGKGENDFFVVTVEAPIHYSQVSLLEPAPTLEGTDSTTNSLASPAKRWVRAKFRYLADGTRVRIGAHSTNATGAIIPIPPTPSDEGQKLGIGGPKDASASEVVRVTHKQDIDDFSHWIKAHSSSRVLSSTSSVTTQATAEGSRSYSSWAHNAACTDRSHLQHTISSPSVQQVLASGGPAAFRLGINRWARSMAVDGWLRHVTSTRFIE